MANRFRPPKAHWYGRAFRIGDRAAAHVWLGDWRMRNPNHRMVVVEDNISSGTEYSRYVPGSWLFKGIADELWMVEKPGEYIGKPPGDSLYHVSMWRIWRWLSRNKAFVPSIRPDQAALDSALGKMRAFNIPTPFVSIQPLFDASYDKHRNCTPEWWQGVCLKLSADFPVVVLGDVRNARRMKVPDKVYPLWNLGLNPMESMAVISMAKMHIGGATGTTLWSAIFNVPTLAVYSNWGAHLKKGIDTRPIPFGAPVVHAQLGGDYAKLAGSVRELWEGTAKSTPWS